MTSNRRVLKSKTSFTSNITSISVFTPGTSSRPFKDLWNDFKDTVRTTPGNPWQLLELNFESQRSDDEAFKYSVKSGKVKMQKIMWSDESSRGRLSNVGEEELSNISRVLQQNVHNKNKQGHRGVQGPVEPFQGLFDKSWNTLKMNLNLMLRRWRSNSKNF